MAGPHASLGIFALPKGGSQKKVKDTGELAKMVNTNTLQEGPDMRSCRKFWTKHLKLGQAKREDRRATRSGVREEVYQEV